MGASFDDEVFEDKRTFSSDKNNPTGYSYPCIIIITNEDNPIPKSRLQTLKGMLNVSSNLDMSIEPISLYLEASKTLMLGKVTGRQVKALVKLFHDSKVIGYLSETKKLEGDMLYVLSN